MLASRCRLSSIKGYGFLVQNLSDPMPSISLDHNLTKARGIKLFEVRSTASTLANNEVNEDTYHDQHIDSSLK